MRSRRAIVALAALAALGWGGAAAAAEAPKPDLGTDAQRQAGKKVYDQYCAQCHGDDGAGDGIAALRLHPRPRDFTSGKFKFRSTATGYLPTDDDLRRTIRDGLPYTGMANFDTLLSDEQVTDVVEYLKTFSADFEDPQAYAAPIDIPSAPKLGADAEEVGYKTYVQIGCARCHGEKGRGDGPSALTLRDDWGYSIRPADLTMPWTFRGGDRPEDIFRSISTGLTGTPMAGFADGLTVEQRWQIVGWILAQAGKRVDDPYSDLVSAVPVADLSGLDQAKDVAAAEKLFADAPAALFPVIGQIMQPGREFHPSAVAVRMRAIYDPERVAIEVSWHDMRPDTDGHNAPDLQAPPFEQQVDPFAPPAPEAKPAAEAAQGGQSGGFWGGGTAAAESSGPAPIPPTEFSDALAVQFPIELRPGVRMPYFLFGDSQYPVELWYVDLAHGDRPRIYQGQGSDALEADKGQAPKALSGYDRGEWTVVFWRDRQPSQGIRFDEGTYVPVAFSVWDGLARERGSKRGLTAWHYVYVEPSEQPSVVAPMAKAGLTVLLVELIVVGLVRRRRKRRAGERGTGAAEGAP